MKGLLLKDFLSVKNYALYLLVLSVFYFFLAYNTGDLIMLGAMLLVVTFIIPLNAMGYDEKAKWDKYALTMPFKKRDLVTGKYLLSLIVLLLGNLLWLVLAIVMDLMKGNPVVFTDLLSGIAGFSIAGIIVYSVLFPLLYKFGMERSRLIYIGILGVPTLLIILFGDRLGYVIDHSPELIRMAVYILPVLTVLILVGSYLLSVHIYQNKEW